MELQVKGSDIPKPITAWSQLPLNTQCKFTHTLTLYVSLWSSEVKSSRVEFLFTDSSTNASHPSCFKKT